MVQADLCLLAGDTRGDFCANRNDPRRSVSLYEALYRSSKYISSGFTLVRPAGHRLAHLSLVLLLKSRGGTCV